MLKTPDAASITQPGRSYLQVGNNEIYELFQSAWSGASYQKGQTAEEKEDDRVYVLNEIGQGVLVNQDLSGPKESNQIKATQLDVVVSHLHDVYNEQENLEVKKPWLPSLPSMLLSPHTQVVSDSATFTELDTTLGLGMIDIPEEQAQREYILDMAKNGHLLYMASSGYGKSLLLGNIIVGLSMKNAVQNLNIYILDWGNSALISYRGLPHVADYLSFDEAEKLDKFRRFITDTITERKKLFAKAMAQNFNVYNQSQEEKLKAIVIALDNYDIIGELGDEMVAFVQKVARDGASLGIYIIATITRDSAMRSATKGNFKERIVGFNFVDGENTAVIGRSQIKLPEDKKGRVLVKQDSINLMQLYTPVSCEDELVFNQEIKGLVEKVANASSEEKAKGIPVLPEVLYYENLSEYPGYQKDITLLPLGIDIDTLDISYLDLKEAPALVVGGQGKGKTNTVKTLMKQIKGQKVYVFDNADGMLRAYAQEDGVSYANSNESVKELLGEINEIIEERKELYDEARIDDVTLSAKNFAQALDRYYVVIDSLQQIYEMVNDDAVFDTFAEAVKFGFLVLATSDIRIKKTTGSDFMNLLAASMDGLALGSIKEQAIFTFTGIREDNRKIDMGYHHKRGSNSKIKLIDNE